MDLVDTVDEMDRMDPMDGILNAVDLACEEALRKIAGWKPALLSRRGASGKLKRRLR